VRHPAGSDDRGDSLEPDLVGSEVVEEASALAEQDGNQVVPAVAEAVTRTTNGWCENRQRRMAQLIYSFIASLDGYIEDVGGRFDWATPSEEAHAFINELEGSVGTYLYGRRMYETMIGWENDPTLAEHSPAMRDFAAIWQAAEKIVYSSTLAQPSTRKTRIEPRFDADAVRELKAAAGSDLAIGGAGLAGHAFAADLVDECHAFLAPAVVGGGKRALADDVRLDLELTDERRFESDMVYLRYAVRR
jgi:dihydrofolate reductase